MWQRINTRSLIVLLLVVGSVAIALHDEKFRPIFGDLAKVAIGGYLGQLIPEK
ncbi:hypothetical protein NIES4106_53450 [Fischerella sp. NIES-4106]|nr:hypothetical protein NIES4106_10160 [Fischerella sp. NIES-4106]BAZ70550.1 hypothetical protein NIES4106_53450 [Fischerella sp. NIES-4106]